MDCPSIQVFAAMQDRYWWFVGRRRVIQSVLERHLSGRSLSILDWGCGPGGSADLLSRFGEVLGVDASEEALRYCREAGFTNVRLASSLPELPPDLRFDLITDFDVLEHIREDEAFLVQMRTRLVPGGHALITVPAYRFLWSELDDAVGHVRRYTRGELVGKLRRAGFEVLKASYFITLLAPPFILIRLLERLKRRTGPPELKIPALPRPINDLLIGLVSAEAWLLRYLDLPFGTSIIALARKR